MEKKEEQAIQFIEEAEATARAFHHPYLGVEHLFYRGLEKGLFDSSLRRDAALELIRASLVAGEDEFPKGVSLPRTPRLKRVLDKAMKRALEKRDSDLPLPLLLDAMFEEKNGLVAMTLNDLGITPGTFLKNEKSAPQIASAEKTKKEKTPLLDKLGRDLTLLAKSGKLDPVIGRHEELRRMMQILARKTKNVPILIGEPGVGKTAVVYAFAERLAKDNVPKALQGKRLIELPLGALVAGTAHRGEMEDRVQKLIQEVAKDPDCILFIDEIHGIIGAGNVKGGLDVANLLKPSLADGSLRVIGATTTEEYQKYLSNDQALERRFQPVLVKEPSEEETFQILQGLKPHFETYHGVTIEEEAVRQAIKLSIRYLPDRRLPDKALDLVDEASSRVKTKTNAGPSPIVTADEIAAVASLWTGIPISKLSSDEREQLLHLDERLKARVVGQDEAIQKISQAIQVSRAGLGNPKRPIGVFLFLGPTGVGKTELAKVLSELLFESSEAMIRLDMSEYKEQHSIAKLIGSPPGYVGHDEEGQLTKAVHAKPYSLILLDEIEKAHPEVFDLFLQIFDDGRLTDSKGRTVNFNNTLIILTSNIGSPIILKGIEEGLSREKLQENVLIELKSKFRPEFLNRIDEIIVFNPLTQENLKLIVDLQLDELRRRLVEQKLNLKISDTAVDLLIHKGFDPVFGARPLRRAVQDQLAKPLSLSILKGNFTPGCTVLVDVENEQITFEEEKIDAG